MLHRDGQREPLDPRRLGLGNNQLRRDFCSNLKGYIFIWDSDDFKAVVREHSR